MLFYKVFIYLIPKLSYLKAKKQKIRNLILGWEVEDEVQRGSKYENINKSKLERRKCTAHMEGFGEEGKRRRKGQALTWEEWEKREQRFIER